MDNYFAIGLGYTLGTFLVYDYEGPNFASAIFLICMTFFLWPIFVVSDIYIWWRAA